MRAIKRIVLTLSITLLCCPQVFADSIMDRMRTRDFSPIDYMGYVLTMWYNGFFNYPFVVRVSIFMAHPINHGDNSLVL